MSTKNAPIDTWMNAMKQSALHSRGVLIAKLMVMEERIKEIDGIVQTIETAKTEGVAPKPHIVKPSETRHYTHGAFEYSLTDKAA